MQQMLVLNANFGLYACIAEAGMVCKVLLFCTQTILHHALGVLQETVMLLVQWAHEGTHGSPIPPCQDKSLKSTLQSKRAFWRVVNNYVLETGALRPVKLFKHGIQSFYSKTKGGVDGATQARALLRSQTSHMQWEPKLIVQVLKTVVVNAFIAWRMDSRQDLVT
jgi:hypothetical protein